MSRKEFIFSRHYREDKDIDVSLTKDCVHTGKKELVEEQRKFKARKKYRKRELIVVYKDFEEYFFVITAFWNRMER